MNLAIVLEKHIDQYIKAYPTIYCEDKKKAVYDIINCRTSVMGGEIYFCEHCNHKHFVYHSCKNRHCPKCGYDDSVIWLEKQMEKLLPVKYFLTTFTLPEELRPICSVNKKLFYNALFYAASESLKVLLSDLKYAGGLPGFTGVLHTWSRQMIYHPHIHFIVPGGAYDAERNQWNKSFSKFLVPVKALSEIYRAKFRDYIKDNDPKIFSLIDTNIWHEKAFVTHSKCVGKGDYALRYLSQYVYKTAISNARILSCENNIVKFFYTPSDSNTSKILSLNVVEFIRRFLDHILPEGFKKIRHFGFLSPKLSSVFEIIKQILPRKKERKKTTEDIRPFFNAEKEICPNCQHKMIWMGKIRKQARSPCYYDNIFGN